MTDRPANHNVEHYSEEDDGHSGGDSDQHYLTVLTGDGKGWGRKRERERKIFMHTLDRLCSFSRAFFAAQGQLTQM